MGRSNLTRHPCHGELRDKAVIGGDSGWDCFGRYAPSHQNSYPVANTFFNSYAFATSNWSYRQSFGSLSGRHLRNVVA